MWQSLQTATAWWLDLVQPSKWSCMTWQLAHAAGSLVRYEEPLRVDERVAAEAERGDRRRGPEG